MFLSVLKDRNVIIKQTQMTIQKAANMSSKAIESGNKKNVVE